MKKIFSILTIAALAITLSSCGNKKTEEKAGEAVEQVQEAATSSSSDIVKKYGELCDKLIDLYKKMKTGDVAATQEYTKLAQEFAQYAQDNADEWAKLSADDVKKIQEIAQKAADEMSK